METFNFNLFLNLVLPLQEGYMPGGTDVTQEPELLLSSLSLLGYAIPLEGSVMVFFSFWEFIYWDAISGYLHKRKFMLLSVWGTGFIYH